MEETEDVWEKVRKRQIEIIQALKNQKPRVIIGFVSASGITGMGSCEKDRWDANFTTPAWRDENGAI